MDKRPRALIVEDEMMIALTIEDSLTELGYEVCEIATTLNAALRASSELAIDVAVLDINLNGQYSLPVAERLLMRGVPFIFQTGYGPHGMDLSQFRVPVICKPFTTEDLSRALRAACSFA